MEMQHTEVVKAYRRACERNRACGLVCKPRILGVRSELSQSYSSQ